MACLKCSAYDPERVKVVPKDAVVLDPNAPPLRSFGDAATLRMYASEIEDRHFAAAVVLTAIADQIEPPRIPEPGLWGVVEARSSHNQILPSRYVRRYDRGNAGFDWVTVHSVEVSRSLRWDDLIDPVLVREGL